LLVQEKEGERKENKKVTGMFFVKYNGIYETKVPEVGLEVTEEKELNNNFFG